MATDLSPNRRVRGVFFVDYVRMIRGRKDVDFSKYLTPEDLALVAGRVEPWAWYPMETFERLGLAILKEIALGQLPGVRMWGRFQVQSSRREFPDLVVDGDPQETMMRFRVLATSFFDYAAIEVPQIDEEQAIVSIQYDMGAEAEETACFQSLGFLEGLMEAAGGREVYARLGACSWKGAPRTLITVTWFPPLDPTQSEG